MSAKTQSEAEKEIEEVGKGDYVLVGEYSKSIEPVSISHIVCGHTWEVSHNNFVSKGSRCPKCSQKYSPTPKEFSDFVTEQTGGEYSALSPYVRNNNHVEMRHNKCGHEYRVTPKNFKKGRRCPRCRESYGETRIRKALENLGVEYEQEKVVQTGLDSPSFLRLDFYLPEFNNVIEYDGEQHFAPQTSFGGVATFEKTVKYDSIKYELCLNQGFSILQISYHDFDRLEEVVEKHIQRLRERRR